LKARESDCVSESNETFGQGKRNTSLEPASDFARNHPERLHSRTVEVYWQMAWEVEYTHESGEWHDKLSAKQQQSIQAAVERRRAIGPSLRRPLIVPTSGSQYLNMKELLPPGEQLRILFAFDRRRRAILPIGGDKTDNWDRWYDEMIPVADRLYARHDANISKQRGERR